jgi:hypothetical protein
MTDKKIPEGVEKLILFALQQTAKENHFFFEYSGHVNTFGIRGYVGEWALHKEPITSFNCSVKDIDSSKAERWINTFISEGDLNE